MMNSASLILTGFFLLLMSTPLSAAQGQTFSVKTVGEFGDQGFTLKKEGAKLSLQKLSSSHVLAEVSLDEKSFEEVKGRMLDLGKMMPKKADKKCRNFVEFSTSTKKKKSQGCLTQNSELTTLYSKLSFDLNLKMSEKK